MFFLAYYDPTIVVQFFSTRGQEDDWTWTGLVIFLFSKNIYFFDPVPKNEVQRVLSYADVCILSWQNISLYKYGLSPNKVFDYMWAAKPILQAVNSPNNQVELASCGENIEPENSTKIMEAILLYANKSDSELKSIGLNGHKYLLEHFEFKNIARIITDEVEIK